MNFKKINKEFCITDSSVNSYGYRLLTAGFQVDRFNPPIGYFMHERDKGVAVRWSDFRIEGDKVLATPTVNVLQFPDLADQIEQGFYDSASVGHIIALEWTDNEAMKLPTQTGITVTKWFCRECSIVDIPGNFNAVADIYDKDENSLSNLISQPTAPTTTIAPATPPARDVESVPAQFYGMSYTDLWVSGDLNKLKQTHPLYVKQLQENYEKELESKNSRGAISGGRLANMIKSALDTPGLQAPPVGSEIPDLYAGKSYADLWISGDLENLRQTHPLYVKQLQENHEKELAEKQSRGVPKPEFRIP